jgi:hypothetical protein
MILLSCMLYLGWFPQRVAFQAFELIPEAHGYQMCESETMT